MERQAYSNYGNGDASMPNEGSNDRTWLEVNFLAEPIGGYGCLIPNEPMKETAFHGVGYFSRLKPARLQAEHERIRNIKRELRGIVQ